jgi:ABC-2 type transport system ATP-binding protein
VDEDAEDLRGRAVNVTGRSSAVDEFVAQRKVLNRQSIGALATATITGPLDDLAVARARELHLELGSVSLQEYVIRTSGVSGERMSA